MCFPKKDDYRVDLSAMYENDGTVNDEVPSTNTVIPEGIIEHIDNPFLIYETRYHILIVWTSDEAYDYIKQL